MSRGNKITIHELERVKQEFPEYFSRLMAACRTCGNCFSSFECDLCEDGDMYVRAQ